MAFLADGDVLHTGSNDTSTFSQDRIVGLSIFIVSTLGVAFNVLVVVVSRFPSMQHPFGKLMLNQAIADLTSCIIFAFYFAPMVFFDIQVFKSPNVSKWFSHIQLMCYDAGNATHFFASVNCLTAIFLPIHYMKHFTMRLVTILNIFTWVMTVVPGTLIYIGGNCTLIFSNEFWNYQFSSSSDYCMAAGWYYDFVKSVGTIALVLIIEIVTYFKCRTVSNRLAQNISCIEAKKRHKKHSNFVKQACLQGIVFGLEMFTYFFLANYFDNRLVKFGLTTFAWVIVPVLDGLITCVYNREIGNWLRTKGFGYFGLWSSHTSQAGTGASRPELKVHHHTTRSQHQHSKSSSDAKDQI